MSDRKGFRFNQSQGKAYWFWPIDRPIHHNQIERFDAEFDARIEEILAKPRSKAARLTRKWRDQLTSIDHDGYGSFRLEFDIELDNYTDAELESFNEDIQNVVCYLPVIESIQHWINIEEDPEGYVDTHGAEDAMTWYVDAVLDSGYRLHQRDVEEMFGQYFEDKNHIAKDFTMRKLRRQDVVLWDKEAKPTMWPFDMDKAA